MEHPRDDQEGYVPNLHEHLRPAGSEDRLLSFEEVVAVRARLTGEDLGARLQNAHAEGLIDQATLAVYTAALATQDLQRGDLGPAFLALLGYTQGSIPQARERMMAAFGRAPSRSYAVKLHAAWHARHELSGRGVSPPANSA